MKDTQIHKLILAEKKRQKSVINLIASENYVSADVLKALGSEFVNKYSEGYPGKRYYGGNILVDKVEVLAQERACKVFGLNPVEWNVNVQPLSGSPANVAVFLGVVPIGGKIMGMSLDQGGHLTHGFKVSITGKVWNQVPYGVDQKTEVLNYDEVKKIALEHKPDIIVAGFTAYPRIVNWKKFREIADACGALLMVDMSHIAGLVAGGCYGKPHSSPFEYADIVTTTVHKTLRGPRSAIIFAKKDSRDLDKKIDKAVFPGMQSGPHDNQIAAVAVALKEASAPAFKKYAKSVVENAAILAKTLESKGWRIVSGGTDTHLVLIDTWMGGSGVSGKFASDILEAEGIIVNKNAIPFDTRPPTDPSGIRLGSAAETTRGKKAKDFVKIALRIDAILKKHMGKTA